MLNLPFTLPKGAGTVKQNCEKAPYLSPLVKGARRIKKDSSPPAGGEDEGEGGFQNESGELANI